MRWWCAGDGREESVPKPKSMCQAEPQMVRFPQLRRPICLDYFLRPLYRPPTANIGDVATYRQSRMSKSRSNSIELLNETAARLPDVQSLNLSGVAAGSPFDATCRVLCSIAVNRGFYEHIWLSSGFEEPHRIRRPNSDPANYPEDPKNQVHGRCEAKDAAISSISLTWKSEHRS